jgi:GTPase Era involved in 16S rRNA processing
MKNKNEIHLHSEEILKELSSACDDFNLSGLTKVLNAVKNFAEENQYLDIAVLGQFKAGKSSFLNSFFNRPLLPTGSIPVTSVITRIQFGNNERAKVLFKDNSSKQVSTSQIDEYISEALNPGNEKKVAFVDIELPSLNSISQLRLVDTPGIGSIWKHNTETTRDWFPETGCVLFIISAEKPISENELNLLEEIYSYTNKIVVLLTKVDLFTEEQIKEIESFTIKVLKDSFDEPIPLIRYSAIANTDLYNKTIEQEVFLPLVQNSSEIYSDVLNHKIDSLAESCLSYLNVSYQASLKKEDEKNKLKASIIDEHLNAVFIRKELQLILTSYKEKTRDNFEAYLNSFSKSITKQISSEYEKAFATWNGNLYQVTRKYESWLKLSLESSLKEILLQENKSFELLDALKKHLSFYLKSFRERLNENIERVLSVHIKARDWEITINETGKPDISISRTFDSHIDLLWFLFPMFLFRKFFKKIYLKQIPDEIENNLYRLTSDLNEKLSKEMDKLMNQSLEYMNKELTTIELLISENKRDTISILERIDLIKGKLKNFHASKMVC